MRTTHGYRTHDSRPSVTASMEEFESHAISPALSRQLSRPHLHFRSPSTSEYSESEPNVQDSWSPPAWRKAGSGWFRHQNGLASPMRSREGSPLKDEEDQDEVDGDVAAAAEIPLPGSPMKGRSMSRSLSPERQQGNKGKAALPDHTAGGAQAEKSESAKNYIRFSVRADVQHRTEPIEDAVLFCRKTYARITKSRYTLFLSILLALSGISVIRALFQEPVTGPTPDLVKVAGLAKSFEPLMYFSENGHTQVVQLGDTGVAVWDLGESVRSTNMTSGPIIVERLDELSDSLKNLALELTRFFASIDGDIDSILIVMEWAQRELTKISTLPTSHLSSAFSNLHAMLSRVGLLENPRTGTQTTVGRIVQELFGQTQPQVTRATLQRTFTDFLGVMEESINSELTASISLFHHFEAIDRQFLNLQRTVIRETDAQEREENEVLSSLWSRVIGGNASRLKKFEKNKQLLSSLRDRTVQNKHVLVDHNGRLLQLRSNLEILRKKLVSPLVRSNDSSTLSVDEQIRGLEGTYLSLRATREAQKTRLYELIHEASAGTRKMSITRGGPTGYAIEDR